MWNSVLKRAILFYLLLFNSVFLFAQLKVAGIFSNHMVLQRDKVVNVWGEAFPGGKVQVSFAGQQVVAITDTAGHWQVELQPMPYNNLPQILYISAEKEKIQLQDILIGDVWLCSGQSNMEYPLDRGLKKYAGPARGRDVAAEEVKNTERSDAVRYIYVEKILNKYPNLPSSGWIKGNDTLVNYITAIGYFFAKEINAATEVPMGIISSSWGGTRIEQWTGPAAYKNSQVFGKSAIGDTFKIDGMRPGQMFKGMIEPLAPFAVKGVLWYQGESNCIIEDQETYAEKMRILEQNWRSLFKDDDLPFYTVQLAPCLYTKRKDPIAHAPDLLPQFWEAQTKCMELPKTYMVVTTDLVDNLSDIHPSYKWVIGKRLAMQALSNEYGKKQAETNSPRFARLKRKKDKLILSFNNTSGTLLSNDGKPLSWFSIAGSDGQFVPAEAIITTDNKVVVRANAVKNPKFVRFAWHETAMPNLVNQAGLPCIPFRTDRL